MHSTEQCFFHDSPRDFGVGLLFDDCDRSEYAMRLRRQAHVNGFQRLAHNGTAANSARRAEGVRAVRTVAAVERKAAVLVGESAVKAARDLRRVARRRCAQAGNPLPIREWVNSEEDSGDVGKCRAMGFELSPALRRAVLSHVRISRRLPARRAATAFLGGVLVAEQFGPQLRAVDADTFFDFDGHLCADRAVAVLKATQRRLGDA